MQILISNRQKKCKLNTARIRTIAKEILRFESAPDNVELSIVLCDDDFIQKLNEDYLGQSKPTDVLSFPIDDDEIVAEIRPIGDVVISIETAERQAVKLAHSLGLETIFLLIHGILHLLGYDHDSPQDRLKMRNRETALFKHLCDRKLLEKIESIDEATLIGRSGATLKSRSPHNVKTATSGDAAPQKKARKTGGRHLDG